MSKIKFSLVGLKTLLWSHWRFTSSLLFQRLTEPLAYLIQSSVGKNGRGCVAWPCQHDNSRTRMYAKATKVWRFPQLPRFILNAVILLHFCRSSFGPNRAVIPTSGSCGIMLNAPRSSRCHRARNATWIPPSRPPFAKYKVTKLSLTKLVGFDEIIC